MTSSNKDRIHNASKVYIVIEHTNIEVTKKGAEAFVCMTMKHSNISFYYCSVNKTELYLQQVKQKMLGEV